MLKKKIAVSVMISAAMLITASGCAGIARGPAENVTTRSVPIEEDTVNPQIVEITPVENQSSDVRSMPSQETSITPAIAPEEARKIALEHANLMETDVAFVQDTLDIDGGRAKYEIEFLSNAEEYDYEIDAMTGEIISFDRDAERYETIPAQSETAPVIEAVQEMNEDRALAIAMQHAGVIKEDISRQKVKLDYDDGFQVYEISFNVGRMEYEYDIDAKTGEILKFEQDVDD